MKFINVLKSKVINFLTSKVSKVALSLLLFLMIGTFGYMNIEDYSFVDGLYMTTITLSTVGYGEVNQLTQEGRIFTIFLILSGVGVLAYAAGTFAEELITGKFIQRYKRKNVEKKIKKLQDHVIICGFGRNGRQTARKLNLYNEPFVVIEKDVENVKNHCGLENTTFVEGDATQDNLLTSAQIDKAKALITALPSDADNLFVVLTARQLNPDLTIISRASNSTSMKKLKIAGANNVIMPDKIGGEHMASLIVTPDLVEFLDMINVDSSTHINMLEISVNEIDTKWHGKTIKDLNLRENTGCTIIGRKDSKGEYQINPDYNTVLEKNMNFIILGRPDQIQKLNKEFNLNL